MLAKPTKFRRFRGLLFEIICLVLIIRLYTLPPSITESTITDGHTTFYLFELPRITTELKLEIAAHRISMVRTKSNLPVWATDTADPYGTTQEGAATGNPIDLAAKSLSEKASLNLEVQLALPDRVIPISTTLVQPNLITRTVARQSNRFWPAPILKIESRLCLNTTLCNLTRYSIRQTTNPLLTAMTTTTSGAIIITSPGETKVLIKHLSVRGWRKTASNSF